MDERVARLERQFELVKSPVVRGGEVLPCPPTGIRTFVSVLRRVHPAARVCVLSTNEDVERTAGPLS